MKSIQIFVWAMIAGLLLTSCASVAHVEKDDSVNFSSYRTFAWADTKEEEGGNKRKSSSLTEQNIKYAVSQELAKQGWREVKNKPDVLLSYDLNVERTVKQQNNAMYSQPFTRFMFNPYTRRWVPIYYPSQFMGYDNNQYEVREGTITISMVDTKTEKIVWQGWTTNEVNSRNLTSKEINNSVKSIFRKFDVAKR